MLIRLFCSDMRCATRLVWLWRRAVFEQVSIELLSGAPFEASIDSRTLRVERWNELFELFCCQFSMVEISWRRRIELPWLPSWCDEKESDFMEKELSVFFEAESLLDILLNSNVANKLPQNWQNIHFFNFFSAHHQCGGKNLGTWHECGEFDWWLVGVHEKDLLLAHELCLIARVH